MRIKPFNIAIIAAVLQSVVGVWIRPLAAVEKPKPAAVARMDEQERAVHVLNRLTFGPRPGDIERVMAIGIDKWIDQQLHPEKIDDHALDARLAAQSAEIADKYSPEKMQALARNRRKKSSDAGMNSEAMAAGDEGMSGPREADGNAGTNMANPNRMPSGIPQQAGSTMLLKTPHQVVVELLGTKLLRATYSERQLQEVMADFWFNHFNVYIGKGADRFLLTSYENDVIRPRMFGKFEDLLVAVAHSPAMLFYLDNWLSVGPNSAAAAKVKNNRHGLNENYGRELLELHTLGVNGGYSQQDVTETARVLTGWTIKVPRDPNGFFFDDSRHEPGAKMVLGHRIEPNGQKEGLELLHILAHSPATAKFICTKLAIRFVSDDPPSELVDRMAKTFLAQDGDIREVLKTMFSSPEFWAPAAYRAKLKTPLEFVVSALRATGADVTDAQPLAGQLQKMGMPLYAMQPPTGYSMKSEDWVSSAALLRRMNFALALTAGRVQGMQTETKDSPAAGATSPNAEASLAKLESELLAGDVSAQTHETIVKELQDPAVSNRKLDDPARQPDIGAIAGLLLGSPEFQRR